MMNTSIMRRNVFSLTIGKNIVETWKVLEEADGRSKEFLSQVLRRELDV
jgi:hypothetical protein